MFAANRKRNVERRNNRLGEREDFVMARCKSCGREFHSVKTMTYSAYGFCSWDCLMRDRTRPAKSKYRTGRGASGPRTGFDRRSR
jgi:hypothetical protein